PFLRGAIEAVAPGVQVIDSAPAVARQVERRLKECGLLYVGEQTPSYYFLSFADDEYCERIIAKSRRI
ncbi:MAG: glutamate racemase, partial [Rikenellaceae bacterium]